METPADNSDKKIEHLFSQNPCRISTHSFMTHYRRKMAFLLPSQNKVHVACELPLGKNKNKKEEEEQKDKKPWIYIPGSLNLESCQELLAGVGVGRAIVITSGNVK